MEGVIQHLKAQVVPKDWGAEVWLVNCSLYCGKLLKLRARHQCSLHHHKLKDETFVVLSGRVLLCICAGEFADPNVQTNYFLTPASDAVRISPGLLHRFVGMEDSEILEISTQHLEADSYRVSGYPSGAVPEEEWLSYQETAL